MKRENNKMKLSALTLLIILLFNGVYKRYKVIMSILNIETKAKKFYNDSGNHCLKIKLV